MKKNISTIVGVIILVGICCAGCASTNSENSRHSGIIQENSTEEEGSLTNNDTVPEIDYGDASYVKKENLLLQQDIVNMNGISYQLISFEKTKNFGDRNLETLGDWFAEDIDASGNLTTDKTYVFVTLCITNKTDQEMKVTRAPGRVMGIESDLEVLQVSEDTIYIDEYWTGGDPSDVYGYKLNPGESITSESGYLLDDTEIEVEGRTLYYEIPHSDDPSDTENKFISLEE